MNQYESHFLISATFAEILKDKPDMERIVKKSIQVPN